MKSFKVNATILEDGLVDELKELINDNKELFDDSEVVLMPDAHKTGGIPVGFTMTVPKHRVAPDFISSDVSCGMSAFLFKDYVPSKYQLNSLNYVVRDLIQVNRRFNDNGEITCLGTLGSGNHFVEIGTNGKDMLITVHSGSRSIGGKVFKKWKEIAKQQFSDIKKESINNMLATIEPQKRQEWLKTNSVKSRNVDFIDLKDLTLRKEFYDDYTEANNYAIQNRLHILNAVSSFLGLKNGEYINTTHNYIDFNEKEWVIRKGSIKAVKGDNVLIPINMRDGVILGKVTDRGEFNNSLPHGAGRILSRTKAFEKLDMEDFKNDMGNVISSTIVQSTLDESPRAYKDINTILSDIGDGLENVSIFKSLFSYKGVE